MPNFLAAAVAALITFMVGGPWYSDALFLKPWSRHANVPPPPANRQGEAKHPALTFGLAYLASFVAACALSAHLGPAAGAGVGLRDGLVVGVAFVATSFGINYSFASRSVVLWAIDAGYHIVQFALLGLILGVWP